MQRKMGKGMADRAKGRAKGTDFVATARKSSSKQTAHNCDTAVHNDVKRMKKRERKERRTLGEEERRTMEE